MSKTKKNYSKDNQASKGNRRTLNGTKIVKTNFKMLPDEELISGLTACCPKRKHIFEHFTDESQNRDLRGIADFLRSGRRATFGLSKVELKEKMFTLFKASVLNAPISGKGPANEPFRHEWRLPNIGNVQCR